MRRALWVLLLLAAGVGLALWLADVGGTVEIKVGDAWIGTSFPIALLLLVAAFAVVHGLLSGIAALRRWPDRLRQRRALRHRADGDAAVTRALVALAAGTAEAARLEVRKARGLLGDTPQTLLLAAEAERLSGREDAAAAVFRTLAEREDARFLGLRGLLRQAMAKGDWTAALALAKEAEANQPGAAWLREERAQLALQTRNWREALVLAPTETPRAPLALAAAAQEPSPEKSAELERQAFQADPAFAPAAMAYAKRLRDGGTSRRGKAVLEDAWAASPHPDLAVPYLADEGDALTRMKAVEVLIRRNPTHAESRLLLGRTAIAAGLTGRARGALDALVKSGEADRRAYLLLAELEEAEHGETVEARAAQSRWLREAAGAAPEPRWRCGNCGTDHAAWAPVCSACDMVGRIAWTTEPRAAVAAPKPAATPALAG
ncbi:heme biosynthesis HemY N-terminal domain-containing protein [Paeniroseomonas aquatica]|uniref:Heme biosynthesis HemY N-terminal domain-containing protein n=1 Tax=Paeniroseomonas aquatica TaxID=373043 RepID=A0ABT8AEL8_9PROT|nr:heme biosynthesis HemY N-terminal domain-containing protein [Paeniroseomonas aquatica]MDN3568143.1 heme biosynthesis HemY N-terminal domain-containing protein [Paeniroseomonas aquatica]